MYQPRIRFVPECVAKGSRFALGLWGLTRVRVTLLLVSATVYSRPRTTVVRVKLPCLGGKLPKRVFHDVSEDVLAWHFVTLSFHVSDGICELHAPHFTLHTPHLHLIMVAFSYLHSGSLVSLLFFAGIYNSLNEQHFCCSSYYHICVCIAHTHTIRSISAMAGLLRSDESGLCLCLLGWMVSSRLGSVDPCGDFSTPGLLGIYRLFSLVKWRILGVALV